MNLRVIDHAGQSVVMSEAGMGYGRGSSKALTAICGQTDFDAQARFQQRAVILQMVEDTAAHGAAANHAEIDLFHKEGNCG